MAIVVETKSAIYPDSGRRREEGGWFEDEASRACEGTPCIASLLDDGRVRVEIPRRVSVLDARLTRPTWSRRTFMSSYRITDTALSDYCRAVGRPLIEEAREYLAREFEQAQYKRTLESGAELWKGRRPHRLRFVVHVSGRQYVVARVLRDVHGPRPERRAVPYQLLVDGREQRLKVLEHYFEPGGERRVAYKLEGGTWAEGTRGAGLHEVTVLRYLPQPPTWLETDWREQGSQERV